MLSLKVDQINVGCIIGYKPSNSTEDYTKLLVTNLWYNEKFECYGFMGYYLVPKGVAKDEFCIKKSLIKDCEFSDDIYVGLNIKGGFTEKEDVEIVSLGYVDYNVLIELFNFIDNYDKMTLSEEDRKKIKYSHIPNVGEVYSFPNNYYNDIFIVTKVNVCALNVIGYQYDHFSDVFELVSLPLSVFQIDDIKDMVIATIKDAEKLNLLVDNTIVVSFRLNGYPSLLPNDVICAINKDLGKL